MENQEYLESKEIQDRLRALDELLNLVELRLLELEIRVSQNETSLRSHQY